MNNDYYEIDGKDCLITIEPRQAYCDRGNWLAKILPIFGSNLERELDHQDGWPRYYFDLNRAQLEVEAWLKKRGQSIGATWRVHFLGYEEATISEEEDKR